jgi:hypothetical protein
MIKEKEYCCKKIRRGRKSKIVKKMENGYTKI